MRSDRSILSWLVITSRQTVHQARHGAALTVIRWAGGLPVRRLRHRILRAFGLRLHKEARIHHGAVLREPRRITIGSNSIIGDDALLDGRRSITIGRNVNLSSEVAIWTEQHDPLDTAFGVVGGAVVVCDRAWLSFRSTILPGVTIGQGAVVAAGAVVATDVAPFTIVAGVPARPIAERPRDLSYEIDSWGTPWFI